MTQTTLNKLEEQVALAKAWKFEELWVRMSLQEAETVLKVTLESQSGTYLPGTPK